MKEKDMTDSKLMAEFFKKIKRVDVKVSGFSSKYDYEVIFNESKDGEFVKLDADFAKTFAEFVNAVMTKAYNEGIKDTEENTQ